MTKGVTIRSKCNWNEDGEKYSNFFLNLKKKSSHSKQNSCSKNPQKRSKRSKLNTAKLYQFYEKFFSKKIIL